MDDPRIQGKYREPSPWPPRMLVIAIIVLVLVAVVRHLPPRRVESPRLPAATASAGPVQLAGLGSRAAGLLDRADGMASPAKPLHPSPTVAQRRLPAGL
jgi:hypothetical protein